MNLKEENARLRYLLWLHHGHIQRLYGDDGEMQCFPCDFKRGSIKDIEIHLSPNKIDTPVNKDSNFKGAKCNFCRSRVRVDKETGEHICCR